MRIGGRRKNKVERTRALRPAGAGRGDDHLHTLASDSPGIGPYSATRFLLNVRLCR